MGTELDGRTAIVTGGSRGIGLGIARSLLASGARVAITGRDPDAVESAASELGDGAIGIAAHAVDEEAASACVQSVCERLGPVDILVNNVGTNPAYGPLVEIEREPFLKTVESNLWSTLLWTRICWEQAMRDHGGVIVNNASLGATAVGAGLGTYHASKAALVHLTRHLSVELAPGVRVNAIAPGIVRTKLSGALWKGKDDVLAEATPLGRIGEPDDIGPAVAFLAGDGAAWITGETLVIDGGQGLNTPALDIATG